METRTGRRLAVFIENNVGAEESRKDQLISYATEAEKLMKKWGWESINDQKVLIYIKSEYDYDDPLAYRNDKGEIISKGFKINWIDLYNLFGPIDRDFNRFSSNSIILNYSEWIREKYKSIQNALRVTEEEDNRKRNRILNESHIGQIAVMKNIFKRAFNNSQPRWAEKDKHVYVRYYYDNVYIKLGRDKGRPWTELWFSEDTEGSEPWFFTVSRQELTSVNQFSIQSCTGGSGGNNRKGKRL